MKKILTYLVVSLFIASISNAQQLEEKEREMLMKHKVKSRTSMDYNFEKGKFSMQPKKTSTCVYDQNGRLLSVSAFNPKGEVARKETFQYDSRGNRILYQRESLTGEAEYKKQSEYNSDNNLVAEAGYDGSATFKTTYVYDKMDRVMEITYYIADDVDEKRVYTYTGNKANVQVLKLGKNPTMKLELTFNQNNQTTEEKTYSLDGKLLENRKITYNANNNIVQEEKYKNGEFFNRISYEYDSKGELIAVSEETKAEAKYVKKKYTYNEDGQVISYQWKRNSADDYNIKNFKYNEQGVCSEEHTYYPSTDYTLLTKYEYTFY
jgi:hypothetical protein